jgi:hypothetical protein
MDRQFVYHTMFTGYGKYKQHFKFTYIILANDNICRMAWQPKYSGKSRIRGPSLRWYLQLTETRILQGTQRQAEPRTSPHLARGCGKLMNLLPSQRRLMMSSTSQRRGMRFFPPTPHRALFVLEIPLTLFGNPRFCDFMRKPHQKWTLLISFLHSVLTLSGLKHPHP